MTATLAGCKHVLDSPRSTTLSERLFPTLTASPKASSARRHDMTWYGPVWQDEVRGQGEEVAIVLYSTRLSLDRQEEQERWPRQGPAPACSPLAK